MKRNLVLALAFFVSSLLTLVPVAATMAADSACSVTKVSQTVNHVEIEVHTGGTDGQLTWPNGPTITVGDGWSGGIDLDYNAVPRNNQLISLAVPGTECSSLNVHIPEWDPAPPTTGGTTTSVPGVNYALMGHGVDDCRFYVASGFAVSYDKKSNTLTVFIQKMGEGARPYTVVVSSTEGTKVWSVQSDPDLSGSYGIGSDHYNLPFDLVLSDKKVKNVYVSVYNALTHLQCDGPHAVSIR